MEFHTSHIPPLLRTILLGKASPSETNLLVRYAHHFALVRLKQLLMTGKLHLQSFPITVESTAIDCIAELFERDNNGVFIELQHFFCVDHALENMSDDDIIACFRSLVFTKLNDGIFRLYRENDPVLSKILRNLKIALHATPSISSIERFGIIYLDFSSKDDNHLHLPEYPIEELEKETAARFRYGNSSGNFLSLLSEIFVHQNQYRKIFSLIDCAVVLKRVMALVKVPLEQIFDLESDLMEGDIKSVVQQTLDQIQNDLTRRYVHSGKITAEVFTRYFMAIEEMIIDTFVRSDGSGKSYDQYLKQYVTDLTYDEYRKHHRIQFEYMTKIAKKTVREQLKELL